MFPAGTDPSISHLPSMVYVGNGLSSELSSLQEKINKAESKSSFFIIKLDFTSNIQNISLTYCKRIRNSRAKRRGYACDMS